MVEPALDHWQLGAMRKPSIYYFPAIYDRVMQPGPCEEFYSSLARMADGPVLELACGTGRLTLPLARTGRQVVGLDASSAMLNLGREKAAAEGVDVTFVKGDMRSFDIGQLFSLIVVSCNSLAHLTTNEDVRACLTRVARHLAPGGVLAFDVINPDVRALARAECEAVRLDLGPNPCSGIAVEEFSFYDPIRQVRVLHWKVREPGVAVRELAPLTLRQFFPQEVPLLLEGAGLKLGARYGDFAGNPLSRDGLNQICIARASSLQPARRAFSRAFAR
jgi:SAM-dependent methyltransferase